MRTCASTNSHEQMNRSGKIDRTCEESLRALKKAGFQVADLCLCSFARTGNPNEEGAAQEWLASTPDQKRVMMIGETEGRMAKPSMLAMIRTMLTNKAVGE